MKAQLVDILGDDTVLRLNMVAQIVCYFIGAVGFYEARSFRVVSAILARLAFFKQFLFHSRTTTVVEDANTGERKSWTSSASALFVFQGPLRPPGTVIEYPESDERYIIIEERREDLSHAFYFAASATVVFVAVLLGRGLAFYLSLPFLQFAKAITVWADLDLSLSVLLVPLSSVWHFILAALCFALIYTFGIGTTLKSFLLSCDWLSRKVTKPVYHFLLFLVFCVAGGLVLATTF